jgi:hypothetical protein
MSAPASAPAIRDPHRPWTVAEKAALAGEIASSYLRVRRWLSGGTVEEAAARARAGRAVLREPGRDPGEYHFAVRMGRIVEGNLGRLPGDTRCLTRSLVLLRMLARRGIAARLVIGVKPEPAFTAHAWVELDGHPLLNPGEYQSGRLTEI